MRDRSPRAAAWTVLLPLLLLMLGAGSASAVQPDELLPNPKLEARARAISAEVRCLVCQNQSIDDSDAPLARDLRILVRERLVAGDDDNAVRSFVVRRYGEFVLLRPVFARHTLLLWLGPVLVVGGAATYLALARRRGPASPAAALTTDEEARLKAVLDAEPG